MKINFLRKVLATALAFVMLAGVVPFAALAGSDGTSAQAADTSTPYRIVMLDCGRKYFSVDNIKKLIDTMAQYGYNQLTLAFGNGGCRFLLDDMSLSFSGTTMTSDTVKTNITNGNNTFNGDTRYLTQSDMDTVISYADTKGIEIVPLLNMPGHAQAILHNTNYTVSNENLNLNVNDETSRNYGYALLGKYVDYFKGKGCNYFHFGADESGFSGSGMSTFLQGCSDVITNAGMTARMFNDPADGTNIIPSGVEITYWYQNGHQSASTLSNNGYSLINTHGRWYYVIKSAQNSEIGEKYWQGTVNTAATSVELPVMKQNSWGWVDIDTFYDSSNSKISNSLGTMFCIWCDASQDAYLTDSQVISEDENYGALYQLEKMAEHYWKDDIKTSTEEEPKTTFTLDSTTYSLGGTANADVTKGSDVTLTVNNAGNKKVTVNSSNDAVATATYDNGTVTVSAKSAGEATITVTVSAAAAASVATYADTAETFKLEVTVSDEPENEVTGSNTKDVSLEVGDTKTFEITGDVEAKSYITDDNKYIATAIVTKTEEVAETTVSTTKSTTIEAGASYIMRVHDTNYALTTNTGSTDWGTQTLAFEAYTAAEADNVWQLEASGNGYKLKSAAGYLNLGTANNTAYVNTMGEVFTLTYTATGWTVKNPSDKYINALGGLAYYYSAGGWTGDGTRFDLYKVTEETEASTTLTITGFGEGKTSVTVGDTIYNITVTAPSTNETQALTFGGSFSPTGTEVTITSGDGIVSLKDGKIVAGDTEGAATVTSVVKNDGGYVTARYTYNVTVSKIDFSTIATFDVTLWCTNTPIGTDGNSVTKKWNGLSITTNATYDGYTTVCTPATINISAADAYGEDGVELRNFVLAKGVSFTNDGTYQEGREYVYWKGVALHDGDTQGHANAASNKDDKSDKGTNFYKIRYWNDEWQYLANDTNTWTSIKDDDSFVAYYLQKFVPSDEITAMTRDWGQIAGEGGGEDDSPFGWSVAPSGYIGLGSAVVYPDKTMSPKDDEGIWNETLQLRYVYGEGSNPGTIYIENTSEYTVTKVTITRGYHADSSGNKITTEKTIWDSKDQVLWDKTQNDAGENWYDETVIWEAGDTVDPVTGRIVLDSNTWGDTWVTTTGNNEAFLILVYVEPVETEDSLKIVYWDDSTNTQINPSDILVNVKSGVTFLDIHQTSDVKVGEFTLDDDATIENSVGTKREINKNITILDGVAANYKSGIYKYVSADISEDGKTLTLHYNIKEIDKTVTYVVDFGLPVTIPNVLATLTEITNFATVEYFGVSVAGGADNPVEGAYGNVTMTKQTDDDYSITYALQKPLDSKVTIPVYYTISGMEQKNAGIVIIPASTVYYEDSFVTTADGKGAASGAEWKIDGTKTEAQQALSKFGAGDVYGYDDAYADCTKFSMGSAMKVTVTETMAQNWKNSSESSAWPTATFTFRGTGFDVISLTNNDSGVVACKVVKESTGEKVYSKFVTNYYEQKYVDGNWVKTESQNTDNTIYQIPVIRVDGLDCDTYKVTLTVSYGEYFDGNNDGSYSFWLDAIRIYNPLGKDYADYTQDNEGYPQFIELHDELVNGNANSICTIEGSTDATLAEYEAKGPNHEVYLAKDQTLAFKLSGDVKNVSKVFLAAKSLDGEVSYKLGDASESFKVKTATDMYYDITKYAKDENGFKVVTVTNTSENLLSLTYVKVTFDPKDSVTADKTETKSYKVETQMSEADKVQAVYAVRSMYAAMEAAENVFEPERLEAAYAKVGNTVKVTVRTSTDVSALLVNGEEVTSYKTKYDFVSKEYYREFTFTDKTADVAEYTVVAIDANGVESEPVTAEENSAFGYIQNLLNIIGKWF